MEGIHQIDAFIIKAAAVSRLFKIVAQRNTMYLAFGISSADCKRLPSGTPVHWPNRAPAFDAIVARDLGA